ncbi:hypothetical protein GLAREA_08397 [Glarea lozoyensis ATCC 20868]|uniref:Uncharacterized protein n=1 Tax=Glarea lozoyensis (strain ATCC 20868 / MF5171) TaxID=1116229 RepID=S3CEX7_GLAL2|nr:uncharacterized protein GLAREA_08397 [Glarea lozoyensis ATCC 20868]EPE24545.1 hypothetical protein GLAREA_08397 [Glarea lozoyensis ATCC 20868]
MRGLTSKPEATYASERTHAESYWERLFGWCWRPQSEATAQPQEQNRYHHIPTHAASSFMKTSTTPAMIPPMEEQSRRQRGEIQGPPVSGERDPNQSLI